MEQRTINGKRTMGKGRRWNALPTELQLHLVEQIGFEPMTDNPMSSAHQNKSGQGTMVDVDCCSIRLSYFHRSGRADLNRQPTVPITHNLRPAKRPTDKRRTGNTCSTTELDRKSVV